MDEIRISKFLSLVLRHQPDAIGLTLQPDGYVSVKTLLEKPSLVKKMNLTREDLDLVVKNNNKQRFAYSEDGTKIRASQGHSIGVNLGYEENEPPEILYHGTSTRFLDSIYRDGILKMNRQHVHLSGSQETAMKVGHRHGNPIVLTVEALRLNKTGIPFYLSANCVWLVDKVPTEFFKTK